MRLRDNGTMMVPYPPTIMEINDGLVYDYGNK